MATKKLLRTNQSGLVSFLMVTVVLGIITLLVLAYAQIARREQRQSLDRQLNSQAFYAAESGVNDAMEKLRDNLAFQQGEYTECDEFTSTTGLNADLGGGAAYSCLLVDPSPAELRYDGIDPGQSQVIPILPKGSTGNETTNDIGFTWTLHGNGNSAKKSGCRSTAEIASEGYQFPADWYDDCELPMLRVELVPFTGSKSRTNLIEDRAIFFVSPSNDIFPDQVTPTKRVNYSQGVGTRGESQGMVVASHCSDNAYFSECGITIRHPSGFRGYARVTPLYLPVRMRIVASNTGVPVELTGAQAEIDVTGKATDVVKRIRVFRSLDNGGDPLPGYALQSRQTQCKQFSVEGGSMTYPVSPNNVCQPTD